MQNQKLFVVIGAMLSTLSCGAFASEASEITGYQPQNAAQVATLPIHVVFGPVKVRPQVAYSYTTANVPIPTIDRAAPGLTYGQTVGANVAGGLIAELIVAGAETAEAEQAAAVPYVVIKSAGCDLDLRIPIGDAATTAIGSAWPGASVQFHEAAKPKSADRILGRNAPRYVFQITTSLAPDFSALITTIDADAYLQSADSKQSAHGPAWHDTILIISDRLSFPDKDKTQADVDQMVAAENARFDAFNLGPSIKRINDGTQTGDAYSQREERKRVGGLFEQHRKLLVSARAKDWSIASLTLKDAQVFSENQCARMKEAISQSASLATNAIQALAKGTLPPRLPFGSNVEIVETPGERSMLSMPGSYYVSRRGGDDEPLQYRYWVLGE